MGRYFSDVVEKAIEDLYYCYDNDRAKQAADRLAVAMEEHEDKDACYFLACCYLGTHYNWTYHPFEEDEEAAYRLLGKGISLGSAAAVLGALRMNMLTPEYQELMTFSSVKEAWEVIYEKAQDGCQVCQYMIGNTYYYLDVIEIQDKRESQFDSEEAWDRWRQEQMEKSVPWFEKAFMGGMGLAGRNLCDYYKKGRGVLIPSDPNKAMEVIRQGADRGYPDWMYALGSRLFFDQDRKDEGFSWALRAAQQGYLLALDIVGDGYRMGDVAERNFTYALECYEKNVAYGGDAYAYDRAGEMYFLGQGTPQDYAKAVEYMEQAYALRDEESGDLDKLGLCYLMGYGCDQNVERGKQFLEQGEDSWYKNYGLGMMYTQGMGVAKDIEKGIGYLRAAGDFEPAKKELSRYKKGFFGGWKRI